MPAAARLHLSPRAAAKLAWAICALTSLAAVAAAALGLIGGPESSPGEGGSIADVVVGGSVGVIFAIVGAMIVARYPRNGVAWILCAGGLSASLSGVTTEYAGYALLAEPGSLPAGEVMAWLGEWIYAPVVLVPSLMLLLFPAGRLTSRRWRPVAWMTWAGMVGVGLHEALAPGRLEGFPLDNPLALGGAGGELAEALALAHGLVALSALAAVVSIVSRLRRASGDELAQLKWLAGGGVVFIMGIVVSNGLADSLMPMLIGFAAVAVAVGVGILKYRLYDIDVVINRTLVYGALTATLAGGYLGIVVLLQLALEPLTASSNLAIAGSTLAVAALFRPARRRIQQAVDRRFYRRRYDAARTLERFGAQLRVQVSLDALSDDLRVVVADTMQPAHVTLWLRTPETGP